MYYGDYEEERMETINRHTVLTPLEVMEILHIGKNSVYDLLNSGKLKGFRIGRSWRISTEALESFIMASP